MSRPHSLGEQNLHSHRTTAPNFASIFEPRLLVEFLRRSYRSRIRHPHSHKPCTPYPPLRRPKFAAHAAQSRQNLRSHRASPPNLRLYRIPILKFASHIARQSPNPARCTHFKSLKAQICAGLNLSHCEGGLRFLRRF